LVSLTWIRAAALALLMAAGSASAAEPPATAAPPGGASDAPPAAPQPEAPVAEPTPQEAEMQSHRAVGHRLYRLGRYEEAVAAFRRAYEVKADARLLFDIAECYREMGAVDQALFYYDRYLAGWPDAFDRSEVEEKVAELEARRGLTVPRAPATARRRHPVMIVEPPPSKPRQSSHVWQRWWFWTAVGVGLAAGIGAALLSSGSSSSVPTTDLGDKRFF
jgi:tetratricopeptide (TPR) repeat protein